jgi:hypothetical protein
MSYGYNPRRRRRSYSPGIGAGGWLAIIMVAIILAACIGGCAASCQTGTATFKITDKQVKRSGSNDDKYLIFTDHGVFEDTDSHNPFHWKTNSSDLWSTLEIGHTYRCDTLGFRNHLLSSYKNLTHCTEVTQ